MNAKTFFKTNQVILINLDDVQSMIVSSICEILEDYNFDGKPIWALTDQLHKNRKTLIAKQLLTIKDDPKSKACAIVVPESGGVKLELGDFNCEPIEEACDDLNLNFSDEAVKAKIVDLNGRLCLRCVHYDII